MKKVICVLMLCVMCVSLLCGCTTGDADAIEPVKTSTEIYNDSDVQLDLSLMSGTVVYSMLSNIMYEPDKYIGQVIRLAGYYSVWEDPETGMIYHSCVIPDATACCAQGMEFVWAGEHTNPDDYPELGTDMIVTGKLESYMEGEYMYLHLVNADVQWLTEER